MQSISQTQNSNHRNNYPLLRVYAFYRIALATTLLAAYSLSILPSPLGSSNSALFSYTSIAYLFICTVSLLRILINPITPPPRRLFLICFIDIVAIILMMHASGGISSGLGMLIITTIAASSIFTLRPLSNLLTAIAVIGLISETIATNALNNSNLQALMPAGILGILFFIAAQLVQYLTIRIQFATEKAAEQERQAIQLEELNRIIVQRMRTGIMVSSPSGELKLWNQAAEQLLGIPSSEEYQFTHLSIIPELFDTFTQWKNKNLPIKSNAIKIDKTNTDVQVSFTALSQEHYADILIFAEDTRELAQQAQQLKLASLGHLTANIAHEIRNPLGAISHASQLLAESTDIKEHDQRLANIIQSHTIRVNQIIENVLQLSRRRLSNPEKINLHSWLNQFINRYCESSPDSQIQLNQVSEILNASFDISHLEQILTNLFDNGLRYSKMMTGKATLIINITEDGTLNTPCLEIIDQGPGILNTEIDRVFEPFFTTENSGSGLGLYIARELCEANQARLYYKNTDNQSRFVINFAHPEKNI